MRQGVQIGAGASTVAGETLSGDFLAESSRRLGAVVLTVGIILVPIFLARVARFTLGGAEAPPWMGVAQVATALLIVASAALYALTRSLPPRRSLQLGFAYQVLGALAIGAGQFWGDHTLQPQLNKLSWVGPWIILFPLVIPARLSHNLIAALITATAPLATFLVWSLVSGTALPESAILGTTFAPYYICAAIALLPAWLVYRLGKRASEAEREARRLGSYRLIKPLGQGGMGEVWIGEHALLSRPAAIKLIKPDVLAEAELGAHETALSRFEREAKITAALRSPHTIELYDFGTTADGSCFYVMELMEGVDMEALVQKTGPVPPARAIHLLRQACESLEEAHGAGLVHRDIKPANLFVCKLGVRQDVVKVLDFGLVTRAEEIDREAVAAELKLTQEGMIVGTPACMPPEQAQGEAVTDKTDVYALGCVAYWLLTGRLVFRGNSVMQILIDHVKTEPTAPSEHTAQPLPPELDEAILTCLAKDPADRPSARELSERLAAVPLETRWRGADARDWWSSHSAQLTGDSKGYQAPGTTQLEPPPA
jgi:serine/threonine-protein kinase